MCKIGFEFQKDTELNDKIVADMKKCSECQECEEGGIIPCESHAAQLEYFENKNRMCLDHLIVFHTTEGMDAHVKFHK